MRVLQLGPYPPPHGGVEINLVALRDYLRARDIHCAVVNLTSSRRPDGDDVYYPRTAFGVAWHLLRHRYDIIHIHIGGNITTRLVGLCFFSALMPWARTLLTFHSGGYPSSPAGARAGYWTLRGFVFRRLDRVIAVSPTIVGLFHRFGLPEDRVHLICPFSVPQRLDAPLPDRMRRFFDSHSHILLGVCGLEPEYNVPLLIDVLSPVRKLFSGAGLVLIGSGSLRGEIESQIAQSPCASNILLCGDLPHAVTLRAIAESSVLLRPTRYDGDSIAVREALHFRTPVIASDNSPRPPGVHVVSLEDLPALIAVIENVLRSRRTSITVPEALGVNDNLERILKVYASIMSGERRAQ